MGRRKAKQQFDTAVAFSGDGANMRALSRGYSIGYGWRYWNKPLGRSGSGIHPDTEYLRKADFTHPESVGRFLPDPPPSFDHLLLVCPGLAC